ncbi:MAG: hypothetical protein IPK99_04015 [Flavobacteriales bacterium]|nr:hypothetical protein [Flavobacteriales bacterium]
MDRTSTFRHVVATFLLSAPLSVLGQWSAGVMGGAGLDHGWTGPSHWAGGLVERRLSDSSSFVLRLSGQWYTPIDRVYTELRPDNGGSVDMEIADRPLDGASCSWLAVWDPLGIAVRRRWDHAGFRSLCRGAALVVPGADRGAGGLPVQLQQAIAKAADPI